MANGIPPIAWALNIAACIYQHGTLQPTGSKSCREFLNYLRNY